MYVVFKTKCSGWILKKNQNQFSNLILEDSSDVEADAVGDDFSIIPDVVGHNPGVWCHFISNWYAKSECFSVVSVY